MKIEQVKNLVNQATQEVLGETSILNDDLTNVVDIGNAVFDNQAFDAYVKSLINHIGRVVFVDRKYSGRIPSVLMDAWEFGSVLEKISMSKLPQAIENDSWNLQDGQVYEQDIFYQPKVDAKFFNSKVTFEIPISITELQVKQSFSNATQLNAFVSMIYTAIENSMTIKTDALIMRTINNFIGETLYIENQTGDYANHSGVKAVNLLYLYNTETGTNLDVESALRDVEFLKYASKKIKLYVNRMGTMSTLFNISGKERFTPKDKLHIVLLDDFATSTDTYLQADTYHNEMTALPKYETISYWQGTGTDYEFDSVSKINVTTSGGHSVELSGIVGVFFDRDALGVMNNNERATTHYNAKGEFTNSYFKKDASYFNSQDENFVVFYLA